MQDKTRKQTPIIPQSKNTEMKIYTTFIFPFVLFRGVILFDTKRRNWLKVLKMGCCGRHLGLTGRRQQDSGDNYIMRSFIIYAVHRMLLFR
jgi:hypothetical protein